MKKTAKKAATRVTGNPKSSLLAVLTLLGAGAAEIWAPADVAAKIQKTLLVANSAGLLAALDPKKKPE